MKHLIRRVAWLLMTALGLMFQSCIHEYPYPEKSGLPGVGNNPLEVTAYIDVDFDISWQTLVHHVEFNTKSGEGAPHHFVIEVIKDGEVVSHGEEHLTDEAFLKGNLRHRVPVALGPYRYEVAAWYDRRDSEGNYFFTTDGLNNVTLRETVTTNNLTKECGYAYGELDLSAFQDFEEKGVVRRIELSHAGAGFQIIAEDVQQFITMEKEALNQGDSFRVKVTVDGGGYDKFDLLSGNMDVSSEVLEYSGRLRLPFAEYDELQIAEGFMFSHYEDTARIRISVVNSALVTVSQTPYFTVPVKRGYITVIRGNVLTNPIDGLFTVDTVWEGIIEMEI